MPFLKKFFWFCLMIFLYLLACYYLIYQKTDFDFWHDYQDVIEYGNDIGFKKSIIEPLIEGFLDLFRFKEYKQNGEIIKTYLMFCTIAGIPTFFLIFKSITYRGITAIFDDIKRLKANPFYYDEWKKENKYTAFGFKTALIDDLFIVVLPLRIGVMAIFFIMMPIIIPIFLFCHLIGFIKGMTRSGMSEDF